MDITTLGEPRASFMKRIHTALERDRTQAPTEPAPEVDDALTRIDSPHTDPLARFADRAKSVGMVVHRVRKDLAVGTLVGVLRELGASRIGIGAGAIDRQLGLTAVLREAGFELVDWVVPGTLEPQYDLDAGITDVNAAVAESGTLICCSGPGLTRGLSLVPPAHVALVRRSDLIEDLTDFYRRQRGLPPGELPSSIAFITGPSKTADIEGELITGVHGPGHVHIVLIEDA
jgi:L-lactate dehydrogenase complex protein LldG